MQHPRPGHPRRIVQTRRKGRLDVIQHQTHLGIRRPLFRRPGHHPGGVPMHEVQTITDFRNQLRITA